jgi:multiple sugar transport system permease protein
MSTAYSARTVTCSRWMLNTTIYAGVSASGASLFAAMAGYLAKFRYRAREAIFLTILGSLMGAITALALPLFLK